MYGPKDPLAEQLQVVPEMIVPSSGGEPQAQAQASSRNHEKQSTAAKEADKVLKSG